MIYTGPSGTETTYYLTPKFEVVYTSAGTDYRHYIFANGKPVTVISRTTAGAVNVRSLLLDHQGSISSIITDSTGVALVGESFTAYGSRREASTWTGAPTSGELTTMNGVTREGYTFQTVLGSMGLNHMNGRIEDSVTGRFLSADPYGSQPANTQSWNRYSYVNNNPLTLVDPTGFDDCPSGSSFVAGNASSPTCRHPIDYPNGNNAQGAWISADPYQSGFSCSGNCGVYPDTVTTTYTLSFGNAHVQYNPAINGNPFDPVQASADYLATQSNLNEIIVSTSRSQPDSWDGYFFDPVTWPPGESSWTSIGNIAHYALYLALTHRNPSLVGRLLTNVGVSGGFLDLSLNGSLAYELKPDSWQYTDNYDDAVNQITRYTTGTGYTPGTWSALGTNSTWAGVSGTFSIYGMSYTGGFAFYYDQMNSASGLLFYLSFGHYNYDSSLPNGVSNLTFVP